MTTRAVTLQACMMAITGYFQSIQKRVKEGKEIYTKEFKYAYDIYKTEMGEPIKIRETRSKNLQVSLNLPVSRDEIQNIIEETNDPNSRNNLDIVIDEKYQDKVNQRFNLKDMDHVKVKRPGPNREHTEE